MKIPIVYINMNTPKQRKFLREHPRYEFQYRGSKCVWFSEKLKKWVEFAKGEDLDTSLQLTSSQKVGRDIRKAFKIWREELDDDFILVEFVLAPDRVLKKGKGSWYVTTYTKKYD